METDARSGDTKAATGEGKTCCGFPRKRVICGVVALLVVAAAIAVIVVLTRLPDNIETQEKNESDAALDAGELTILKTAALSGIAAEGTLSLLRVTADNSSFLALNDFAVADSDCVELEVRLDGAADSAVVPLNVVAADFTEPLEADFDADLFDQGALWCGSDESQLSESVELVPPTTLEGTGTVVLFREATMSGSSDYTVEGQVQIVGSGSIVDGALVITHSLRFQDIEVSPGPDVYLYLTTDEDDPTDVGAEGSLRIELDESEEGTFSFTGTFTQTTLPEAFVSPEEYVAAVVWCDAFSALFGSGLFEDVQYTPAGALVDDIVRIIPVNGTTDPGGESWADSYSDGDRCYMHSTFDHDIGDVAVDTPRGNMTILELFGLLEPGPGADGRPLYNDIQCGNGPANTAGDETDCPGLVEYGPEGCGQIGPLWDLSELE